MKKSRKNYTSSSRKEDKKMKPYGYLVPGGYFGRLEDRSWRLFPTEGEYLDYIREDI